MRSVIAPLVATLTLCLSGCASAEFKALQSLSPGASEEEVNMAVSNVRPQLLRYVQPLRFYDRYRLGDETLMSYGHSVALLENGRLVFVQQLTKENPPVHFDVTSTVAAWKPEATVFLEIETSGDELLARKFRNTIERIFKYRQIAIVSSKKEANQIVSISIGRSVSHQRRSVTTPIYSYVYNQPISSQSTISSPGGEVLGTIDTKAGGGFSIQPAGVETHNWIESEFRSSISMSAAERGPNGTSVPTWRLEVAWKNKIERFERAFPVLCFLASKFLGKDTKGTILYPLFSDDPRIEQFMTDSPIELPASQQ